MLPVRSLFCLLVLCGVAVAQPASPPTFRGDVQPFLARYCVECHPAQEPDGGLSLDSYKGLLAGGEHGPVLVPGKPDESRIVRMVEKKATPHMPPRRSRQPSESEVAVLRAWVAAGAKDDGTATVLIPDIKPRQAIHPPVTALAYRPDGGLLAAGVRHDVWLLDPKTGEEKGRLSGQPGLVSALAFSPDGARLAVASGDPGQTGIIQVHDVATGRVAAGPIDAHADRIHALAFSPDGATLASCSYDRLIRLWNAASGQAIRDLKDHSDAVYGIAFSPDGKLLASAAADRAVKIWQVDSGKRLYTLAESTDWVYAVAFAPDGRHVAAGGVDRSIRVWRVGAEEGEIAHSVFAHDGPVTGLVYSADGKTLYSLSEDRTVKAWDAARMVERKVYDAQPETVHALGVRPDEKQLALGRFDGALVLLDATTGKPQGQPLPAKPKPPVLNKVTPDAVERGKTVTVNLDGAYLDGELVTTIPGARGELLHSKLGTQARLAIPPATPPGVYQIHVKSPAGESKPASLTVDRFPLVAEAGAGDSPSNGQEVTLSASIAGVIEKAGDVDYYRFTARAGQEIGVQVQVPPPQGKDPKLDPVLTLVDPTGQVVLMQDGDHLGHTCTHDGVYALGIRDREYRGQASMTYRLHVGEVPVVTSVFPAGIERGKEAVVQVEGVHLGKDRKVRVKSAPGDRPGANLTVPLTTPLGPPLGRRTVVVSDRTEVVWPGNDRLLPVPATGNGRILSAGHTDTWRFIAKKGQTLVLEVEAQRIGSPVDSYIEILDAKGNPLPAAVLRSLAKTYTVFRNHNSQQPGIRIESWSELAINDYLLVGTELIRIKALPRNPDDDCQFYQDRGKRLGYLGTTPTFHPPGEPMYKVSIHPPGTTFPPNGLPVVTLYHRNDDNTRIGTDSRLLFEPPADGEYQVRVGDSRGQGGPGHVYRLVVTPARPDFTVSINPRNPAVNRGGALPIKVNVERNDGFDGPVEVHLENLPPGFSAPATTVFGDEAEVSFALFAEPDAAVAKDAKPMKLVARAVIGGKEVRHEIDAGIPKAIDPGDIVTTTDVDSVSIRPGGKTQLTVTVERRNNFKGRIPLDVRGLPPGVRVLDIGLNGILITEKENRRTIVLYAEPWVAPCEHPIVVLARREGTNTAHAARSVMLRVGN